MPLKNGKLPILTFVLDLIICKHITFYIHPIVCYFKWFMHCDICFAAMMNIDSSNRETDGPVIHCTLYHSLHWCSLVLMVPRCECAACSKWFDLFHWSRLFAGWCCFMLLAHPPFLPPAFPSLLAVSVDHGNVILHDSLSQDWTLLGMLWCSWPILYQKQTGWVYFIYCLIFSLLKM